MTAECPKCHAENRDDSKYCRNCAAPLGQAAAALTRTLETPVQVVKPGTVISGKYRIVEELGHGGMGIVHKAEDIKLKRFVALKFLPPPLMDSSELKERFLVEAQAAAALNHPNICVIHEVGEDEARPYIAMEFVDGETLKDKLRRGRAPRGRQADRPAHRSGRPGAENRADRLRAALHPGRQRRTGHEAVGEGV